MNCTHFPPSVAALDLSLHSSAPVLGSLRVLVLSHLAELETNLARTEIPSKESLKTIGEEKVEEARACAREGLEMLRRIRDDVLCHFPELPFDAASVEKLLKAHLHDLSSMSRQDIMNEVRAHLPELPQMPSGMSVSESVFAEMHSKLQDVRSHIGIPDVYPLEYLPTLSSRLQSLHAHLSSLHAPELSWPSFSPPSSHVITDLLDKVLSSDLLPNLPTVLHRTDDGSGAEGPFEKAAREVRVALKASLDGSCLISYTDLPMEWRNNHFVQGGYRYVVLSLAHVWKMLTTFRRFIPLSKWPVILLSLFAFHNETRSCSTNQSFSACTNSRPVNIHTHMIPFLHTLISLIPSLNYSSISVDTPERVFTIFAQTCLLASVVWHTMAGCAHRKGMEFCARVDYVGIGW
jgi:adiponectin receptor